MRRAIYSLLLCFVLIARMSLAQGPGNSPGSVTVLRSRNSDPATCTLAGLYYNTPLQVIRTCLGGTWFSSTYTVASGSTALGTSSISSATCASVVTVSTPGVTTTDRINASFNGDPTGITGYVPATSGTLTIIPYPTANNVNFKVCNNTASPITPGTVILNWGVVRP